MNQARISNSRRLLRPRRNPEKRELKADWHLVEAGAPEKGRQTHLSVQAGKKPGNKYPISFLTCRELSLPKLEPTPGNQGAAEIVRTAHPPGTDGRVQKDRRAHGRCPRREVLENEAVISRGRRGFLHLLKRTCCFFFGSGKNADCLL